MIMFMLMNIYLIKKKSYKHHYLNLILILSCCLLFICLCFTKQTNKTKILLKSLLIIKTYTSLTKESTPMDYYLIHDRVDIADKVQIKKRNMKKSISLKKCGI